VLGVDPRSDSETIQRAYARLAQKYHANSDTADAEKFEAVNIAYEVLSDASLRLGFDKIKGVGEEQGTPKFSGAVFFDAIVRERDLRMALMSVLYDRRRTKPLTPSLSMRHIENMLAASSDEITFTLWYLKQRCFVANDDKSSLQITVEGMDFLENNRPSPENVMAFIKPAAMPHADANTDTGTPPTVQVPTQPQPPAKPQLLPKSLPGGNASTSNMLKINQALTKR